MKLRYILTTLAAFCITLTGCFSQEFVPPITRHEHNFRQSAYYEPSCVSDGYIRYTCVCGALLEERLPSPGHDWDEWNRYALDPPTCTADGLEIHFCTVCNASETRAANALGHDWSDWNVSREATCMDNGEEYRNCLNYYPRPHSETRIIPALGHDWGEWKVVRNATCTEDGREELHCMRDRNHFMSRAIQAKGHTKVSGYGYCLICGEKV